MYLIKKDVRSFILKTRAIFQIKISPVRICIVNDIGESELVPENYLAFYGNRRQLSYKVLKYRTFF